MSNDRTREQAVKDARCGWCQQGKRHMPDEHASSIAAHQRAFSGRRLSQLGMPANDPQAR